MYAEPAIDIVCYAGRKIPKTGVVPDFEINLRYAVAVENRFDFEIKLLVAKLLDFEINGTARAGDPYQSDFAPLVPPTFDPTTL